MTFSEFQIWRNSKNISDFRRKKSLHFGGGITLRYSVQLKDYMYIY